MESIAPFEIEAFSRDWIVGTSGQTFFRKVKDFQVSFAQERDCLVLREEEVIEFAAQFFAAVSLDRPVALANPKWGAAERVQFKALLAGNKVDPGAILIPTGGTTGGVKLAVHNWASLAAAVKGVQGFLGGGPINSCCLLPLYHVSGLMQLVRSFVTGGKVRFDDDEVEGYCLSLVPTQLQRELQKYECIQKLNTARVIFIGGAGLPDVVAEQARRLALPVVPVYGMTETAAMVAAVPNEDFLNKKNPGAVSLGDAQFEIEPDGRIRIRTVALFRGYQGQPELDLSKDFVVDDEGFLDKRGRLHVIGRVDRLINTGGEKVDPREVETALLEIDSVSEVLVLGEPDDEWGQSVVAYIVGDVPRELEWYKEQLHLRLAHYKFPKRIHVVSRLPLDERGKFSAKGDGVDREDGPT